MPAGKQTAGTVWYEIIFGHLNGYNSANMPDIDKIPFDNCLDINSWHSNFFDLFDLLMTLTSIFDLGTREYIFLVWGAPNWQRSVKNKSWLDVF